MHRSPRDLAIALGIISALTFAPVRSEELPPGASRPSKDGAEAPPAGARERAHLGVLLAPRVPGDEKSGVVVTYVNPASAAREIGLLSGDEIRVLNDVIITDVKSFIAEIQKQNAGSKQRFSIRRGGMDMKLEGRLSSIEKTMKAYQEILRKELLGKPLPELPPLAWWDAASGGWKEAGSGLASLTGKHSVVFSFDDCPECRQKRYRLFLQTKEVLDRTPGAAPLAFLGIFYADASGKERSLKSAEALFREMPPSFPVAVAFYPGDKPAPEDREKHALLHTHGTAILDPAGSVKFLQTHGAPREEFLRAYEEVAREAGSAGGGQPGKPAPAAPPTIPPRGPGKGPTGP